MHSLLTEACVIMLKKASNSFLNRTFRAFCCLLRLSLLMMKSFLRVFGCRNATVHKIAMLAIGALAYMTGPDFAKDLTEFYKYLEMRVQNLEEYQVCAVTVDVVGDICRAPEDKIMLFCDGIMNLHRQKFSSNQLHRSLYPPLLSCLGDIALAIGENFDKYCGYAMPILQDAAEWSVHISGGDDDELTKYINLLRNGILEGYSGIFQGFRNTSKTQRLIIYAPPVLQFLDVLCMQKNMDEAALKNGIGVLGDLAETLENHTGSLIQQSIFCKDFLNECLSSEDLSIKESAEWARLAISRAIAF